MDHQHALNRLRSRDLLSRALIYAIFDRVNGDHFHDPQEIEHAQNNRDEIIAEIITELQEPENYLARPAFAYFPPKNALCDRRMVYIPIKDLAVRYAIAILFSVEIEYEIHPQCFANRRSSGDEVQHRFTEDFATGGWTRFCQWQSTQCENHSVLLRTDISAFYDSISHEYLIDAVTRHLVLPANSALISLLRTLLQIPVIYYSPSSGEIEGPAVIHQGLPIGDGVEGFLANILLKDVDDSMASANASYGRYVDDIRLFGDSRTDVMAKLRILQEQLLRKGLNLNASKTKIAEDQTALQDLLSQLASMGEYGDEEDASAGSVIAEDIDQPFESFSRSFTEDQRLASDSDAKDFCKFLSAHDASGDPLVPLSERTMWHLARLQEVIREWRGPGKHSAWLLVQTAFYRGVESQTSTAARNDLLQLLADGSVSNYIRYRLLYHAVKERRRRDGSTFRFIDQLNADQRRRVRALLPTYIASPAFELNIIGFYTLRLLGAGREELRQVVTEHARPHCQPLRTALSTLSEQLPQAETGGMVHLDEPDAIPEPY